MQNEFFSFGGLESTGTRRLLDGLLTIVDLPAQVFGPAPIITRDLARITHALTTLGRSPSPIVCFMPSAQVIETIADTSNVTASANLMLDMADIPVGTMRMSVLREDGCELKAAAFTSHVVFARKEALHSLGMFDFPGLESIVTRRHAIQGGSEQISSEELLALGLVDIIYEDDAEEAVLAYIRSNDKRRNGEMGLLEAIRISAPLDRSSLNAEIEAWLSTLNDIDPLAHHVDEVALDEVAA